MTQPQKMNAVQRRALERVLDRYYSYRQTDIRPAIEVVEEAIESGRVRVDANPIDIVCECLFGRDDQPYLAVRALALQIMRDSRRIGTTSTGETLAAALLFRREDWLGSDTWAYAAKRVGPDWLNAIVSVEDDFRWLKLPLKPGPEGDLDVSH